MIQAVVILFLAFFQAHIPMACSKYLLSVLKEEPIGGEKQKEIQHSHNVKLHFLGDCRGLSRFFFSDDNKHDNNKYISVSSTALDRHFPQMVSVLELILALHISYFIDSETPHLCTLLGSSCILQSIREPAIVI